MVSFFHVNYDSAEIISIDFKKRQIAVFDPNYHAHQLKNFSEEQSELFEREITKIRTELRESLNRSWRIIESTVLTFAINLSALQAVCKQPDTDCNLSIYLMGRKVPIQLRHRVFPQEMSADEKDQRIGDIFDQMSQEFIRYTRDTKCQSLLIQNIGERSCSLHYLLQVLDGISIDKRRSCAEIFSKVYNQGMVRFPVTDQQFEEIVPAVEKILPKEWRVPGFEGDSDARLFLNLARPLQNPANQVTREDLTQALEGP